MMADRHEGFKITRVTNRDRKAELFDIIVQYLWPERQTTPPDWHDQWEPGDGPHEWSSDTLQWISDFLHGSGEELIDAG